MADAVDGTLLEKMRATQSSQLNGLYQSMAATKQTLDRQRPGFPHDLSAARLTAMSAQAKACTDFLKDPDFHNFHSFGGHQMLIVGPVTPSQDPLYKNKFIVKNSWGTQTLTDPGIILPKDGLWLMDEAYLTAAIKNGFGLYYLSYTTGGVS